jgi:hypothetical protein
VSPQLLSPAQTAQHWHWCVPAGCDSPAGLDFSWVLKGTVKSRKQSEAKSLSTAPERY